MAAVLSTREIAAELRACRVALPDPALEQLRTYLELLLHWNQRINLTGLKDPRLIVRRLFGESLYLGQLIELRGWLVDVGSGAGFPGLALKLAAPGLRVTLLEPRRRRAAFLKEAIRHCGFTSASVVVDRFESWAQQEAPVRPNLITTRAVELSDELLALFASFLDPAGTLVCFTTVRIGEQLRAGAKDLSWEDPVRVPGSTTSAIVIGKRKPEY